MRTHIVGTENRYYETEEEADAGCTPIAIRQLVAHFNSASKTWTVTSTISGPVPAFRAVPLRARLALALACAETMPVERTHVLAANLSLRKAYNLVRADEEQPELIATLPVLRQFNRPESSHEYWRNMPQPD